MYYCNGIIDNFPFNFFLRVIELKLNFCSLFAFITIQQSGASMKRSGAFFIEFIALNGRFMEHELPDYVKIVLLFYLGGENMKRMPFEPPTEHYDEEIEAIDEQICNLIKQRKDLSNNNPGFPTKQLIANWAKKYNFYEDFLNSVFAHFLNEQDI